MKCPLKSGNSTSLSPLRSDAYLVGTAMQKFVFPDEVTSSLGHYVYRLVDPRNNQTFYVGQGQGNRVFDHVYSANRTSANPDDQCPKRELILEIQSQGLNVDYVIHRHGLSPEAVSEVEAALIDCFPALSNKQGGHGSNERGPMSPVDLIKRYALPELDESPPHRLVLININRINGRHDWRSVLAQVRFCWRLSLSKATRAEYVLAVEKGVVVGAFKVTEWLPATKENFPGFNDNPKRFGFNGTRAESDIWEYYVGLYGKRISNPKMRHVQNPVRYWNI